MKRWIGSFCLGTALSLALLSIGCSNESANVAEPQIINQESGNMLKPEDGMPGSMKTPGKVPPVPASGEAAKPE